MFEAFAIGVSVRLVDHAGAGLLSLAGRFRHVHTEASKLQEQMVKIGKIMKVGSAMSGAGLSILGVLTPALKEAQKFQKEATKFTLYGMSDKANLEATRFAKSMNVIGSSYVDNMRIINEAQGIFRESGKLTLTQQLEGTKIAAPILARLSFIESSLSEDKQNTAHANDLAMLRFIESRGGANDPRIFASIADWGFKLSKSSGGIVPWTQLQQFQATASIAGFKISQNAIAKLEPIIADLGGGRTGSGLRFAFQRLLGTQRGLPVQAVSEFLSLGLWDKTKVELSKGGGVKRFIGRPGEVLKDRILFATDPVAFYQKDFLPALAKKYGAAILGNSAQAQTERAVETSMIFGPATAAGVFSQVDKLAPAVARSVAAQNMTLGIDAALKAAGKTLSGQQKAVYSDFHNTLELTGEAILPLATSAMRALLPPLRAINAFALAHPKLFNGFIGGIVGLGAALVVGGTITNLVATGMALKLLSTGVKGALFAEETGLVTRALPLVGTAVSGLATMLGGSVAALAGSVAIGVAAAAAIGFTIYEIVKHWDASKSALWNIKHEFSEFLDWFSGLSRKAINLLPKPMQMPVAIAAADATGGLTDGTFVARMKAVGAIVSPLLSTLKAVAAGLSGHVRSWFDFGLHLVGAFGRVHDAITGFLARMLAIPGQWVAAHIPKLPDIHIPGFAPAAAAPAKGGKPAPAGAPKTTVGSVVKLVLVGGIPGLIKASWSALPSNDKIKSGLAGASFLDAPKAAGNWLDSILPTKGQAHAAGQDVSKGVAGGMVAAHPAVRAAAAGTAGQAVAAFKAAADIHSPSRVFAALGDQLVLGLIMGIDRTTPGFLARLGSLVGMAGQVGRGIGGTADGLTQKLTSSVADRASQAMAFFKAHGWSGVQAAGIVANLVRESGLNYTAVNAKSGAYGITQWLGARVRNFAAFTGHTLQGSSLLQQLAFTDHELRTTHAKVGRALMLAQTPAAAAALVNNRFEINGVRGEGERRGALASQLASMIPSRSAPQPMRFGTMPPVAPRPTLIQQTLAASHNAMSTVNHFHRAPPLAPTSAQPTRSPYVVPHTPHRPSGPAHIYMDGRKVGEIVAGHLSHEASRPHAGVSSFDHTMSPAPVGLGYHP